MMGGRALVGATLLSLHFFLVLVVALEDLASTQQAESSFLPPAIMHIWSGMENATVWLLGKRLSARNPYRQLVTTYNNCAGIDAGYSYFAPSIPANTRLVFELHHPDGHVDYDLPGVGAAAGGYRVSTFLDHLQMVHYEPLRRALMKTLVSSTRDRHPDVVMIRAVFGVATLPTPNEYRAGKRITYQALYAYDFRFQPDHSQGQPRL